MGTAIMMVATTAGGNENALASIDSPMTGNLIGVEWSGYADFDTDNDCRDDQYCVKREALAPVPDPLERRSKAGAQLLRRPRQLVHDQSWCLTGEEGDAGLASRHPALVGHAIGKVDRYAKIPDIPIGMGERLYIHSRAAAGVVATVFCLLHFDFDLDKVQVRRR